jgi:hypothetical protein
MTRPVQLTIESGRDSLDSYQQVHGEIIEEGRTASGEDYIIFRDQETEKRIPRKKIKKITDVNQQNTTQFP